MVKVLRCHNFRSQTILPSGTEPQVICSGNDKTFIGTSDSTVEVYYLEKKSEWQLYCSFRTGAPVIQITYNKAGDYIATLECKTTRGCSFMSVKVYLNWSLGHYASNYRTRVRVASLGYRSSTVEIGKRLEVVDIPCAKPASYISTCQQTGNLAIVSQNVVNVYHLVEKTIPNSETTFLDVELFLELTFADYITAVNICEHYIAVCSLDIVQVLKVTYQDDAPPPPPRPPDTPCTSPGFSPGYARRVSSVLEASFSHQQHNIASRHMTETRKSHMTETMNSHTMQTADSRMTEATNIHMTETTDIHMTEATNSHGTQTAKSHMTKTSDSLGYSSIGDRSSSTPSPRLGNLSKVRTYSVDDDTHFVQWEFGAPCQNAGEGPTTDTLILKGLTQLAVNTVPEPPLPSFKDFRGGSHKTTGTVTLTQTMFKHLDPSDHCWIHLQLVPTYLTGSELCAMSHDNAAPVHSSLHAGLGAMCCLMSGARVGFMYSLMAGATHLSTYKYSSDAQQMETDGRLVYVIKDNGLEVYTARCHINALHHVEKFDKVTKACPAAKTDICMIGVQQFPGTTALTLTDKHVVLLTKVKVDAQSDSVWNVYVLETSGPADLYRDMVAFGSRYQQNAADTYHHLLLEGHMTLRSSLIGQLQNEADVAVIKDLLLESCALLGDYYAMPNNDDWVLCLPYYVMSGLGHGDVVRQAVQYMQHCTKDHEAVGYGPGLVQYLNYILFQGDDPLTIKQSDGDLIVSVCAEAMAEQLSDIVLFSSLRTYTPTKTLQHMQRTMKNKHDATAKTRAKDTLAVASLHLQLGEPESALSCLGQVDKKDLVEICISHHQVLRTNIMELSPLSQLLRCHCGELLISILVMLHDRGTMPLDLAIKLLQGPSGATEIHRNTHIRSYLEAIVNDESRKYVFEEAVPLLCEIYIQRLCEWEPPSCRQLTTSIKFRLPHGNGHFGRRHGWLDHLQPFTGPLSIQGTCRHVVPSGRRGRAQSLLQCQRSDGVCPCFLCNEDLLKLQSLLCSDHTTTLEVETVMSNIEQHQALPFHDSVHILCMLRLDVDCAISLIVDRFPGIAATFGASFIRNTYLQWQYLLNCLLQKLKSQVTNPDETEPLYVQTLKEVLVEMAALLEPSQFLQVLPPGGGFPFFLPYIQLCVEWHRSSTLRHAIVTQAHVLSQEL